MKKDRGGATESERGDSSPTSKRPKRSKSFVERLGTDLTFATRRNKVGAETKIQPTNENGSKKRKKVTLTMMPDPVEGVDPSELPLTAKRIKIEAIDKICGGGLTLADTREERFPRRLSLGPSRPSRPSSRDSSASSTASMTRTRRKRISSTRKSVELTICLHPELEACFQAGKAKIVGRRQSTSSLPDSVVRSPDRLLRVKTESTTLAASEFEPTVDKKPFKDLDVGFPFANSSTVASDYSVPKKRSVSKKLGNIVPRPSKAKYAAPKSRSSTKINVGDYAQPDSSGRHSFDGLYIPNGQQTDSFSQLDHRRQTLDPNPASNLELSLFSWSSTSLSPIQDNSGSAFSNLPSTNPLARSPTPLALADGFPDAPSPMRQNLATAVENDAESLPPSAFHSGATPATHADVRRLEPSSLQTFTNYSSVTPPPPPFDAAFTSATATPPPMTSGSLIALGPSSMASSFCATPSPSIVASNPSESSISNHLSGSSSSSSSSLTASSSPFSLDNSLGCSALPSAGKTDYSQTVPGVVEDYPIVGVNRDGDEANNNVRDLTSECIAKKEIGRGSLSATPSKRGPFSPAPSDREDSKSSLELFNIRLTDDVIVLKCSVCDNYTVECRSLSDVTILTKVSNHIMEHVDLIN